MKKIYLFFLIFMGFEVSLYAQPPKKVDTLAIKDFDIPTSPAFILLDQTPTSIERPKSSKAFVVSALNSFQENNGIPKNYAVEFTPFWFFKHPKMTALKYAGLNENKQRLFGDILKASFSMAILSSTDTVIKKPVNNLAIGMRVNILTVRSKKNVDSIRIKYSGLALRLKDQDERLEAFINDPTLAIKDTAKYKAKVREFFKKEQEDEKASIKNRISIKDDLAEKPVFAIDAAAALNGFYIDNKYSDRHFGRGGVWLTASFSQDLAGKDKVKGKNYFNAYAIVRYLKDKKTYSEGEYLLKEFFDTGFKLEFELRRFSLGYEYIYRKNNTSSSYRSSGLLKYRISDKVFLTGAFGKNFGDTNNLISMLGINWGISTGLESSAIKEP